MITLWKYFVRTVEIYVRKVSKMYQSDILQSFNCKLTIEHDKHTDICVKVMNNILERPINKLIPDYARETLCDKFAHRLAIGHVILHKSVLI